MNSENETRMHRKVMTRRKESGKGRDRTKRCHQKAVPGAGSVATRKRKSGG